MKIKFTNLIFITCVKIATSVSQKKKDSLYRFFKAF